MNNNTFFKHVRGTAFTKDYTLCGKVVDTSEETGLPTFELHIGVHVFNGKNKFIKRVGKYNSLGNAITDPLLVIKLDGEYSLHTFLDTTKLVVPSNAIRKSIKVLVNIKK